MKNLLKKYNPCQEAVAWAGDKTIAEAWETCERGDWMLWLATRLLERKIIVRAACAVARTSLKFVKEGELRPLKCIETTEAWCDGKATIEEVKAARAAAAAHAAAAYAAYAAAYAAATYAAATYAAKKRSLLESAQIVRSMIPTSMILEAVK